MKLLVHSQTSTLWPLKVFDEQWIVQAKCKSMSCWVEFCGSLALLNFNHIPMGLLQCSRAKICDCPSAHYDDVIKWKHLPHYWPSARIIHQSLDSPHKGQAIQSVGVSIYVHRNNLLSKQFICWWFKMPGQLGELQYSKDSSEYVAYLMVYTISWQAQFEIIEHQCHMKIAKVAHCMSYTYSQYSSYCAYTQHDVLHVLGF